MQAIVLEDKGVLNVRNRDVPPPSSEEVEGGEVLVRTVATGICGSDLPRAFQGKAYHYPLVLGHECSAVVEDPGTSEWSRGDRVVIFPLIPRRDDPFTVVGEYALGSGYDYYGSRRDGGMQEYLRVPASNLRVVPDHVSLLEASMTEPAAVALHGVDKLRIQPASSALVIGGGPIGAMVAQFLRIRGCLSVTAAEPDPRKREVLETMGFTVIDPSREDTVQVMRELTGGAGAQCVVEAVGLPATFEQAFRCCATGGQLVLMGNIVGSLELSETLVSSILRRELTIHGTWNSRVTPLGRSEWEEVLSRLGSSLQVKPLISHQVSIGEVPEIMQAMYDRSTWYNKVVVIMDADRAF
ncbi:MAG: galactitol-1-phosphate 5-dehydrogenase [Spirochaetaceae bacterium]|nr:MAG: galactitol-1-phosphate 5-dehydrogenase [Spirochaetaceae bacterium]